MVGQSNESKRFSDMASDAWIDICVPLGARLPKLLCRRSPGRFFVDRVFVALTEEVPSLRTD